MMHVFQSEYKQDIFFEASGSTDCAAPLCIKQVGKETFDCYKARFDIN